MFHQLVLLTLGLCAFATGSDSRELKASSSKCKAKSFELCAVSEAFLAEGPFHTGIDALYSCDDTDLDTILGYTQWTCSNAGDYSTCTEYLWIGEQGSDDYLYVTYTGTSDGVEFYTVSSNVLATSGDFPKKTSVVKDVIYTEEDIDDPFDGRYEVNYKTKSWDPSC